MVQFNPNLSFSPQPPPKPVEKSRVLEFLKKVFSGIFGGAQVQQMRLASNEKKSDLCDRLTTLIRGKSHKQPIDAGKVNVVSYAVGQVGTGIVVLSAQQKMKEESQENETVKPKTGPISILGKSGKKKGVSFGADKVNVFEQIEADETQTLSKSTNRRKIEPLDLMETQLIKYLLSKDSLSSNKLLSNFNVLTSENLKSNDQKLINLIKNEEKYEDLKKFLEIVAFRSVVDEKIKYLGFEGSYHQLSIADQLDVNAELSEIENFTSALVKKYTQELKRDVDLNEKENLEKIQVLAQEIRELQLNDDAIEVNKFSDLSKEFQDNLVRRAIEERAKKGLMPEEDRGNKLLIDQIKKLYAGEGGDQQVTFDVKDIEVLERIIKNLSK